MPVTSDQAQQLASLACAIRPHGARRWDAAGVFAALGNVKHLDLAEVAIVAIVGAADRSLETPAAIGNTASPLWQRRWRNADQPQTREPYNPGMFCAHCSEPRDRCERRWADDHEFESAHDYEQRLARDPRRNREGADR